MLTRSNLLIVQDMNLKWASDVEYKILRSAIIDGKSDIEFDHIDHTEIDRLRNVGGFIVNYNQQVEKWIVSL